MIEAALAFLCVALGVLILALSFQVLDNFVVWPWEK